MTPDAETTQALDAPPTAPEDQVAEQEAAEVAAQAAAELDAARERMETDEAAPADGALPVIGPAEIPRLEMVGFAQARQVIIGVAISAQDIDAEVFAATVELGGRLLTRERIAGMPAERIDQIETDLAVMRSVDKFRKALKEILERAEARAALRTPEPSPDELLAAAAAGAGAPSA